MNKTSLVVLSLAAFSLKAGSFEMGPESVHVPSRLAGASVSFDDGSFYVNQGTQTAKVESYNLDSTLRGISGTNLTTFLDHGYLTLNQYSDGEFSLKANGRVLGGGWWEDTKHHAFGKNSVWHHAVGPNSLAANPIVQGAVVGAILGGPSGAVAGATVGKTVKESK